MRAHERGKRLIEWAEHMYSGNEAEQVTDMITDLLHAYAETLEPKHDPAPSQIVSQAYDSYEYERSFA